MLVKVFQDNFEEIMDRILITRTEIKYFMVKERIGAEIMMFCVGYFDNLFYRNQR